MLTAVSDIVEVRAPRGELLVPLPMDHAAFEAARARLGGMLECSATMPERPPSEPVAELSRRVCTCAHVAPVGVGAPPPLHDDLHGIEVGGAAAPLRFAGSALAGGATVLIVLARADGGGLRASVHAEDTIGAQLLLDELRVELGGPTSPKGSPSS